MPFLSYIYRSKRLVKSFFDQFQPVESDQVLTNISNVIQPVAEIPYPRIIQRRLVSVVPGNSTIVLFNGPNEEWHLYGLLMTFTTSVTAGVRQPELRWKFPGDSQEFHFVFNATFDANLNVSITALRNAESVVAPVGTDRYFTIRLPEIVIKPNAEIVFKLFGGLAADSMTLHYLLYEPIQVLK